MADSLFYRALLRRQVSSGPSVPSLLRMRMPPRPRPQPQPQQRRWQSNKPEDPIPVASTVPPPAAVPFWMRLGPLTRATQAYGRAQRKRPWVVQLCTSLTIFFLGDISAQRISGSEYDPERTARSIAIGGLASIPNYEWCALPSYITPLE